MQSLHKHSTGSGNFRWNNNTQS